MKKDTQAAGQVKTIRIALLGSFTLNGFRDALEEKCNEAGLQAVFYTGGYNQYARDIADPRSRLYAFRPEVTFLLIDARHIFGDLYLDPYSVSAARRAGAAREAHGRVSALARKFSRAGTGILAISNLEVPVYSPLGILETKECFGYRDMVRRFNALLDGTARRCRNVFVVDHDACMSGLGKSALRNDKMRFLADMQVPPDAVAALCDEYMRYIRACKGLSRKCLVLDLDNTLWGGIVGEDGVAGIRLGPTAPGNAYVELQKRILALYRRGIILAVNSSNNEADALAALRDHPHMVLGEKHFAAIRINWEPKVKNLAEIAREINIGLDSLVYLDDDARTRQMVREVLPQVLCPEITGDPSDSVRLLEELRELDALQITGEDRKRGARYVSERRRKESMAAFGDLGAYLAHLKIAVTFAKADAFAIPRIAQLALRTNQFNFSTVRYTEEEVRALARDPHRRVRYVSVRDAYGEYGITGAVIARVTGAEWHIESFILSCRILGKNIEEAVMAAVIREAAGEGASRVTAAFVPTGKNEPVAHFLKANGAAVPAGRAVTVVLHERGRKNVFIGKGKHVKVVVK